MGKTARKDGLNETYKKGWQDREFQYIEDFANNTDQR